MNKKSAINYLYNGMNIYKITEENKKKEEIISQILNNNE
jgi:hypothetical protein